MKISSSKHAFSGARLSFGGVYSILKLGSVMQSLQDLSVATAQRCCNDAIEVSEGCCFLSRGPFFPTNTGTQSHNYEYS